VRQPEFGLATLLLIVVTFLGSMLPSIGPGPVFEGAPPASDGTSSVVANGTSADSLVNTTSASAAVEKTTGPMLSLSASILPGFELTLRPTSPVYDVSATP
jgi:hypothetical protein